MHYFCVFVNHNFNRKKPTNTTMKRTPKHGSTVELYSYTQYGSTGAVCVAAMVAAKVS